MKLNPYLHFKGNAEEALNFYATCLNGDITQIGRYGDSPMASDEDWKQKIMHARLVFDGNLIMVSDVFKGQEVSTEGNIQMSVEVDNLTQLETVFYKMADGGVVTMALQDTFWGARFGMLKDKFGVSWMFNCEQQK
ncbi:MAG: glyoxalase/bleomycin resistance/extradiol dioxygenase family protein [Ferruginibacter sp.]|nr:glyoxalase/bleomycin resistance/extradiol dioxygenase family protein [Ferruginibacter sp.]